jgi:Tol biopolymer transport system component
MRHTVRSCIITFAAAACVAVLLQRQGNAQKLSEAEKAKIKSRNIAQTIELASRVLTIYDRQGKVIKTVGPKGLYSQPVFSPDAKRIAVVEIDLHPESTDQFAQTGDIFVYDADTGERTRITASGNREQAIAPVWSPDGTQLAYLALRKGSQGIYRKPSNGQGSEELLYKLPGAGYILSDWSLDGKFLNYSSTQLGESVLYALPVDGEHKPVVVTKSTSTIQAARLSPDSRLLAYRSDESGKFEVYVRAFDPVGGADGGKWKVSDGGLGMVAWRRDGQELFYYAPDRGIMSVSVSTSPKFEFGKPKLLFKAPDSFPVAGTPGGSASISRDGQRFALIVPPPPVLRQITVLDRQGKTVRKVGKPGLYGTPALSPDGTRVAVVRTDPATDNVDIWSVDMRTGKGTAITIDEDQDITPIWSPDGRQILYVSIPVRNATYWSIYRKAADGSGSAEQLFRFTPGASLQLTDVSADGKYLGFSSGGALFVVALTGTDPLARKAVEYLRDEYNEFLGRFSPDSRFVAYVSDASERNQIWVRPFDSASGTPLAQDKWKVSQEGGDGMVAWRGDGKELYFLRNDIDTGDMMVMAADIAMSPSFQAGTPKMLFRLPMSPQGNPGQWKNVTKDGQQFIFTVPVAAGAVTRAAR